MSYHMSLWCWQLFTTASKMRHECLAVACPWASVRTSPKQQNCSQQSKLATCSAAPLVRILATASMLEANTDATGWCLLFGIKHRSGSLGGEWKKLHRPKQLQMCQGCQGEVLHSRCSKLQFPYGVWLLRRKRKLQHWIRKPMLYKQLWSQQASGLKALGILLTWSKVNMHVFHYCSPHHCPLSLEFLPDTHQHVMSDLKSSIN